MKRLRLLHDVMFGMLAFIIAVGFLSMPAWVDGQVARNRDKTTLTTKPKPVEVYYKPGSERLFVVELKVEGYKRTWFTSRQKMVAWCDQHNLRPRMVVLTKEVEQGIDTKLHSSPKNR